MNSKGQIIEIAGIVVIIGIAIIGTLGAYLHKDAVFVADNTSMNLYSYVNCKGIINTLDKNNIRVYDNQQRAENDGYRLVGCWQYLNDTGKHPKKDFLLCKFLFLI